MRCRALLALCVTAESLAGQALVKKQIVEDMRIDAAAEDLPDVAGVRVGPSGQIAIYVAHDKQLRFYGADGRRIGTFGRAGRGPGEFLGYSYFGWVGDTLWLYDPSQLRVTYVSPALKLLRIEPVEHISPMAVADGRYIGSVRIQSGKPSNGVIGESQVISVPIRARGKTADTLVLAREQSWSSIMVSASGPRGGYSSTVAPFAFYPRTILSPDGSRFAVVSPDTAATPRNYTITVGKTRGGTIFQRTYPNTGERIPAQVAESVLTQRARMAPALRDQLRARMPKSYPALREAPGGVVLGRDGSTWIQTWSSAKGSSAIALDDQGKPAFEVHLPPRATLVAANRSAIWIEHTDADDLTSIVRYRIR